MGMINQFEQFGISDDWAAHRARGSQGGTDFATPAGTPIIAPNPGYVSYEAGNGSGGYIITLSLDNSPGYKMQFLHCSGFEGGNRQVSEGEVIGYTGGRAGAPGSGSSTGPHVHIHMVDPNGNREDVMPWFAQTPAPVAPPAPPVQVAPAKPKPRPKPVKPVVKPTPVPTPAPEVKPALVIAPLPAEATHAANDALGILIPSAKGRKIAYAVYGLAALIVSNLAVGIMAAGVQAPVWLVVASALVGNLAVPFTTLAIANASNKK